MKLLAVGGGSGGHVTPVLAVINELSEQDDRLEVLFVCDRAFESQSRGLMQHAAVPVKVSTVSAGKLRRYHGETWRQRLTDVRTIAYNVRDIFYIIVGFFQSLWLLLSYQPDVVFAKGGYVCMPMGLAAWLLRRPLVIHDSDTRPGLTNKVLGKFAAAIATGSPLENYNYPGARSRYVGVPIDGAFHPFTAAEKRAARHEIGVIDLDAPLVVVTGGGLGAKSINDAMIMAGKYLVDSGIHVYHIAGKKHYEHVRQSVPDHPHYIVVPFVYKNMQHVLGAADVVVARGSATFLQELAGLAKPVIVVPAQHLSDQVKNAYVYKKAGAAKVLSDTDVALSGVMGETITGLLKDRTKRDELARRLHQFARPHAARDVADMIMAVAAGKPIKAE